jgi:hypothetical protein
MCGGEHEYVCVVVWERGHLTNTLDVHSQRNCLFSPAAGNHPPNDGSSTPPKVLQQLVTTNSALSLYCAC